jgi:hypothetical protein
VRDQPFDDGFVAWEVMVPGKKTPVESGSITVPISSIRVDRVGPERQTILKSIQLGEFTFSLGGPAGDQSRGFGLSARRIEANSFSWEWFNVEDRALAHKLQEKGELEISMSPATGGYQVIRTEFLTLVSCRVVRFGLGMLPKIIFRRPDWRLNILRGSVLNWPTH